MVRDYIIVAVISYLLGSVSFSVLISTLIGIDIRKKGSGNAGATNMARIYGAVPGFLTFGLDALKAAASAYIGNYFLGDVGIAVAGMCCLIGHCFPVFYKFKGGKGVSVGGGLAFAMDWRIGVFVIAVFLIVALATKKVSAGSCVAAVSIVVATIIFRPSVPLIVLTVIGMLLVIFQHRGNIKRLKDGTEADFKFAKKNSTEKS